MKKLFIAFCIGCATYWPSDILANDNKNKCVIKVEQQTQTCLQENSNSIVFEERIQMCWLIYYENIKYCKE